MNKEVKNKKAVLANDIAAAIEGVLAKNGKESSKKITKGIKLASGKIAKKFLKKVKDHAKKAEKVKKTEGKPVKAKKAIEK